MVDVAIDVETTVPIDLDETLPVDFSAITLSTPEYAISSKGELDGKTYRVIRRLGSGTYGTVDLIEIDGTREYLAQKTMVARDSVQISLFRDEIDLWRSISSHPKCVKTLVCLRDYEIADRVFRIYMEYVDGHDLQELISSLPEGEYLSEATLLLIARQLIEAVSILHSKEIVHNDIKPSNIIFNSKLLKLADFGVSCSANACPINTRGTPKFFSPEKVRFFKGRKEELSPLQWTASDIWALGATLYYLAERTSAFEGDTIWALYHNIEVGRRRGYEHTPPIIRHIIDECLVVNPRHRATIGSLHSLVFRV